MVFNSTQPLMKQCFHYTSIILISKEFVWSIEIPDGGRTLHDNVCLPYFHLDCINMVVLSAAICTKAGKGMDMFHYQGYFEG